MRFYMHAKIHKATITQADIDYVGSITIDQTLLDKTGLHEHEKVLIVSNTSGARLETYIIPGEADGGEICMNGAAAHLIKPGEEVIIIGFALANEPPAVKTILVDKNNRFVRYLHEQAGEKSATAE